MAEEANPESSTKLETLISDSKELIRKVSAETSSGSCVEGPKDLSLSTVTIGHVLELLLSAACLHKVANSTIFALLGASDASKTNVDNRSGITNSSNASTNNAVSTNGLNKVGNPASDPPKESVASAADIWARLLANPATSQPEKAMKILQDIIKDGLLDSILPYVVSSLNLSSNFAKDPFPDAGNSDSKNVLCPTSPGRKVSDNATFSKNATSIEKEKPKDPSSKAVRPSSRLAMESRKNSEDEEKELVSEIFGTVANSELKTETVSNSFSDSNHDKGPPIVIHVCDEAHGLRQDFTCQRDLLITHIGYFADVTAGQRLEDVDISVHCDVSIFDWLLKWVKRHEGGPSNREPILEPKNAISILISADFLKMSPLAEEVLKYVHVNANLILEAQVNLSCLTDSLLTKLARLFNHWELEGLRDTRDRLQNKLYARSVQSLCDVNPQPSRGIYRTAASIYLCSDCGKLVSKSVERLTDCLPINTQVTTSGTIYYAHSRDPSWNLTDHVRQLKQDLKSWRLVYWRLWGQVHFLPCSTCGVVFPGTEVKLCRQHRMEPNFGVDSLSSVMSSVGDTYPCCGVRALKFSPLPLRNGCQFIEHTVQLTRRHQDLWGPIPQIYDDLLTYQVLICIEAPVQNNVQQKVLWKGVPIVPSLKHEKSFLDRSWLGEYKDKNQPTSVETEPASTTPLKTTEPPPERAQQVEHEVISEEESESSEDEEDGVKKKKSVPPKMRTALLRKAARAKRTVAYEIANEPGWRWDSTRSTRLNQDAQRDRETKVLRELTAWLSLAPTVASEAAVGTRIRGRSERKKDFNVNCPDPGTYYKLETEFKEKFGTQERSHHPSGPGGIFRAKVQAISRIKMRLRNRAAFSANR